MPRILLLGLATFGLTIFCVPTFAQDAFNVLTYHNGNDRTGRNLQEVELNAANVNVNSFGKLFSVDLDGNSFGQPLYAGTVHAGGVDRPVVYVATEHNSVYAIDARTGAIVWHVNLGTPIPRLDISEFSHNHMPANAAPYYNLYPEIGITSTPVIDPSDQTIFVVAKTKEPSAPSPVYKYSIHALDLKDGSEKNGGPVVIDAKVGADGSHPANGAKSVSFDSFLALNRAALTLLNGRVYVAFGSQGDVEDKVSRPFHGWLFGFEARRLNAPPRVFCTSPSGGQAGIWQSGGGLATDAASRLLAATGNGSDEAGSYGNSLLSFSTNSGLDVQSWYTPPNSDFENAFDLDLGSGGPLVVPDADFKDLVIIGGKSGMLYLLRRSSLGHGIKDSHAIQAVRVTPAPLPLPQPPTYHGPPRYNGPNDWHHLHGTPVYWNGPQGPTLYLWPEMSRLKAFSIRDSKLRALVESKTIAAMGMPGAALSLSAHGKEAGTGILWASRPLNADANTRNVEGILEAYDATHIENAEPIWTNRQNIARDGGGFFAKFSPPTVAEGHVYLSTFAPENPDRTPIPGKSAQLVAYGLLDLSARVGHRLRKWPG